MMRLGHPYFHKEQGRYYINVRRNGIRTSIPYARCIMEEYIGRDLLPTEDVHHKNEDKKDDRIENLEVVTHVIHVGNHKKGNRHVYGEHHPLATLTQEQVDHYRDLYNKKLIDLGTIQLRLGIAYRHAWRVFAKGRGYEK